MEYFTGSPEDAEPTAEELGLKSPIAKQVYGLSRKVRELQGQLKEKDKRIAELKDQIVMFEEENGLMEQHIVELELQAQQMDDAYKSLQDMLFKAEQRIAELEAVAREREIRS